MGRVFLKRIKRNFNLNGVKKAFSYPFRFARKAACQKQNKRRAYAAARHYQNVVMRKKKLSKLRFGAYIMYDTSFACEKLINLMKKDASHWDIKLVVIPDVSRGHAHMISVYRRTKTFLIERYGNEYVEDGYDADKDIYADFSNQFDIIYCSNPYDAMAAKVHSVRYISTKDVLPVYIGYGFENARYISLERLKSYELNLVWKCFTETTLSLNDYRKHELIKGRNVILKKKRKMDSLNHYNMNIQKDRKKILLSPHHSVASETLPFSNFLQYFNLILHLPDLFPDIDFIFRPHPLLFYNLLQEKIWTQEQADKYLKDIAQKGIEYSAGGDYFQLFSECDAIVHDCGSYITEWLYTGKPCCFVRNRNLKKKHLTRLGMQALEKYSCIARSADEIIAFIRAVEEGSIEYKRQCENNRDWILKNIMVNYPRASEKILEEIDVAKTKN